MRRFQPHRLSCRLMAPVVVAALVVAAAGHGGGLLRAQAGGAGRAAGSWKVIVPTNGDPWQIDYGSGAAFPQVAALDVRSGYFRLVAGTTWGTSIVLPPPFWSGGMLQQGVPIRATHRVDGDRLVIEASGERHGLTIRLEVALSPPADGRITAEIKGRSEGKVALDARPGEAFKVVMLSSMRVSRKEWDASAVLIDDRPPLGFDDTSKTSGFFIKPWPVVRAKRFGLLGGQSDWQKGQLAPTVEILLDAPLPIAGWRTQSTCHDDDNLGLWASADSVLDSWHYTIIASRPTW